MVVVGGKEQRCALPPYIGTPIWKSGFGSALVILRVRDEVGGAPEVLHDSSARKLTPERSMIGGMAACLCGCGTDMERPPIQTKDLRERHQDEKKKYIFDILQLIRSKIK